MERPEYIGYIFLNVASIDIHGYSYAYDTYIFNITYDIGKYRQVHIVESFTSSLNRQNSFKLSLTIML